VTGLKAGGSRGRSPSTGGAAEVMRRCEELGRVSDDAGCLTRTFHSPAMRRANRLVGSWMRGAGMEVREDAAFNLIGRRPSRKRGAKSLVIGSHLDTVRNAGRYDGPLGVLLGIGVVERLRGVELPFHLEVAGFSDEEGVRYQTTYLGSRAMCGMLQSSDLRRIEEKGLTRARRAKGEFLAYIEAHIEQGPVLEAAGLPLGVVTAIAGQTRIRGGLTGRAGHAGTTPMHLRRDALCGTAEVVLAAEKLGVLATIGEFGLENAASNVIPGRVRFTVDVRDVKDAKRRAACTRLRGIAADVARRRGLTLEWEVVQETPTVTMDAALTAVLKRAAGRGTPSMPSGAGHDAAVMARVCPAAMLFIRCKGGVSHHPEESVKTADVAAALDVLTAAVLSLGEKHGEV